MDWLLVIVLFTVGYLIGRWRGKKQGFKQGLTIAPLIFRHQSLKEGNCVLCEAKLDNLSLKQEYDKLYRNKDFR